VLVLFISGTGKARMRNQLDKRYVVSSGGVIYRVINGNFEVALIRIGDFWCLPKGLIETGESPEEAALREVKEETGLTGELGGKIGEVNYTFLRDKRYFKTVHFYLFKYVGGSVASHDSEVDDVRWFSLQEASKALVYPNERRILGQAQNMLKK
jgi:8-oxo-dGTP pyrophosphatase MutT (NUDIX family)